MAQPLVSMPDHDPLKFEDERAASLQVPPAAKSRDRWGAAVARGRWSRGKAWRGCAEPLLTCLRSQTAGGAAGRGVGSHRRHPRAAYVGDRRGRRT
jgi:hypothetical protein